MKAYKHKAHAELFAGRVNGTVVPARTGGWYVLITDLEGPRTSRYTLHGVEADKSFGNRRNSAWHALVGGPTSNPELNSWMTEVLS